MKKIGVALLLSLLPALAYGQTTTVNGMDARATGPGSGPVGTDVYHTEDAAATDAYKTTLNQIIAFAEGAINECSSEVDFTGDIKTDVISESTAATGVTIDGVLLKDGSATFAGSINGMLGSGSATMTVDGNGQTVSIGDSATPLVVSDSGGITVPSTGTFDASGSSASKPFDHSADCSGISEDGSACWETDAKKLWIGDGSAPPTEIGAGGSSADTVIYNHYGWGGASSANKRTANECNCYAMILPMGIDDLDRIGINVKTSDADDTVELGVFSWDGATQYFEATVDVTSTGNTVTTNDTASPTAMTPGNYWICQTQDNTTLGYEFGSERNTSVIMTFDQAGCNGEMPATLTSPTPTLDTNGEPWFAVLIDD